MVPLAWALRCAGHQVLVAAPKPIARYVRAAGLEHVPVGGEANPLDLWQQESGPAGDHAFSGEPWAALAERTVEETVDLVRRWDPQLVISEHSEFSGPIAAALHGVPSVSHHWGLHLSDPLAERLFSGDTGERLRLLRERFGLIEEDVAADITIDLCPASLVCFDNTGWLPMRHIPYGGTGIPQSWLWEPRTRPRVCVSMGTVPIAAGVDGLREVVRGVAGLDVEVVLTGAGSRNATLTDLPGNVRAAGWLPHDQVFPTCDAVIHHGGSGTAMNSLLTGLPQLVLPQMCDQFENAERLVAAGAARTVAFADRSPDAIAQELRLLLADPTHRQCALRIRSEIESMPAPGEVVLALEACAESPLALAPVHS
ncbi:DUF1205 domain-containing protein [Saccharopolyspora taberi]|uniref:DUF1205 domain-containing protein n=2 Tax=Saccharopolyspora taberi TaxID=60895 RepID=A0ABN3VBE4_9PSEU